MDLVLWALAAVLIGAFGTLVGVGGGILLVPILLFVYPGEPPGRLTAISLAVVLANAVSGSAAYFRLRRPDYRSGIVLALATIPGAVLGAALASDDNLAVLMRRGLVERLGPTVSRLLLALVGLALIGLAAWTLYRHLHP